MEKIKKETEEKDKKYNIILGIMIFLFVIIVGIVFAWGLGYIHFGKQVEDVDLYTENTDVTDKKDEVDDSNKLAEAYVKYSDIQWQRNTSFDGSQFGENVYIDSSTGKVVVETINTETFKVEKSEIIENIEGNPKYVAVTLTCAGYEGSAILTEQGYVYLQQYIYDNVGYIVGFKYEKLDLGEKIVDIAALTDIRSTSCFNQEFYFLTETGKLINADGETYEERNEMYKTIVGNIDMPIYIYTDNTIGYILLNNCDGTICEEIRGKFKYNNETVEAKSIFIVERTLDSNSKEFDIIGHSPTYTAYILTNNGDLLYLNDYEFDSLTLNLHSSNIKNVEAVSDNSVRVNYADGTSKVFDNANIEL